MAEKWAIVDGFDAPAEPIRALVRRRLEQAGKAYTEFRVNEMKIDACRACGACGTARSPGQCILKDDLDPIIRAAAQSDVLLFLTPVRFGGYPSQLKKVLERFMNLGSPYYTVWNGLLMHRGRYGSKSLLGIGLLERELPGEEESFRKLMRRNGRNLLAAHQQTVVLRPGQDLTAAHKALEEALSW